MMPKSHTAAVYYIFHLPTWVIANACFGLPLQKKKNVHEVREKIAKTSVLYPRLSQFYMMVAALVFFLD